MESYRILIKKSAAGEIAKIPRKDLEQIVRRVRDLEQDPRPSGCRKLSGKDKYRLRQGDYRIVYAVDDSRRIVEVYKIGNKQEIYRDREHIVIRVKVLNALSRTNFPVSQGFQVLSRPQHGFVALAAFGDQAFDFPPFLLAVGIFLFDFTRHEKDALIRDLEDHGGTFFQVEDIADGGGVGEFRVIYEIYKEQVVVYVIKVGLRRNDDVYRAVLKRLR